MTYGSVDADRDTVWFKYDDDTLNLVAKSENSGYSEFLIQDFEQKAGWDSWFYLFGYGNQWVDTTETYSGNASYKITDREGTTDLNWGAYRTVEADSLSADFYYSSCWVKSNKDAYLYCRCNFEGGSWLGKYHHFENLTDSQWQKIETVFDLSDVGDSLSSIAVFVAMGDSGTADSTHYANFDNIRFHPITAHVETWVYDDKTGLISAKFDLNNIPSFYRYDGFLRHAHTLNYRGDTLRKLDYNNPKVVELRANTGVEISNPDHGLDSSIYILDRDQYLDYQLYVNCSTTTYSGDAWIRIDTALVDSIHCNASEFRSAAGESWAQTGDTVRLYVYKANEGLGEWNITADIWADEIIYNPLEPAYVKQTSYAINTNEVVSIQYYDPLGQLIQQRTTNYLINGQDTTEAALVAGAAQYDAQGRRVREYKPYFDLQEPGKVDDFTPPDSLLPEANAYYDGTHDADCNLIPYAEKSYYNDVKGRIHIIAGPDTLWSMSSGRVTTLEYSTDDTTMITTSYDPDSVRSTTIVDRWGLYETQRAFYTNSNNQDTIREFTRFKDLLGRVKSILIGNGNGSDSATLRTYGYDDIGHMTEEWRVDRGTTHILYDKMGRVRFVRNAKHTDESSFIYAKYDAFGRKIEEGLCDYSTGDPGYDTLFTQDYADSRDFPNASSPGTTYYEVKYTWLYDYVHEDSSVIYGRMARTQNPNTNYEKEMHLFPLDYRDSVVVTLLKDYTDKKSIVHEYNPLSGQLEKMIIYPDESDSARRVIEYEYDLSGRLRAVEEGPTDSLGYDRTYARYRYLANGRLDSLVLGYYSDIDTAFAAQILDYAYNAKGMLTDINDPNDVDTLPRGNGIHFGLHLSFAETDTSYFNGRCDAIKSSNTRITDNGCQTNEYTLRFNELGWLQDADHATINAYDREYSYNFLGNRTAITRGTDPEDLYYYYTDQNGTSRLKKINSVLDSMRYDPVGNLVRDSVRALDTMVYDYRNLLTYAELDKTYEQAANRNKIYFDYDETGLRIRKKYSYYWREYTGPGGGIESFGLSGDGGGGGGDYTYHRDDYYWHYVYDNGVPIAVFDNNDQVLSLYVIGLGGQPIAVYSQNDDDKRYYLIKDQINSTRVVVNDSGSVSQYVNYHPFGEIANRGTSYDERFKFTNKEFDDHRSFDYYYFHARYYDPELGVFSSVDNAGQFASGYNYCGNNPILCFDQDGNEGRRVWKPCIWQDENGVYIFPDQEVSAPGPNSGPGTSKPDDFGDPMGNPPGDYPDYGPSGNQKGGGGGGSGGNEPPRESQYTQEEAEAMRRDRERRERINKWLNGDKEDKQSAVQDPTYKSEMDECLDAEPIGPESPECDDYGDDSYIFWNLSCFCKCAGDNVWSNHVRSCLHCAEERRINRLEAHITCYDYALQEFGPPPMEMIPCLDGCLNTAGEVARAVFLRFIF